MHTKWALLWHNTLFIPKSDRHSSHCSAATSLGSAPTRSPGRRTVRSHSLTVGTWMKRGFHSFWNSAVCYVSNYVIHSGFHDDPLTVELLVRLNEVTAIRPQSRRAIRHHRCASAAAEARNEFPPPVSRRHHFTLQKRHEKKERKRQRPFNGNKNEIPPIQ